MGDVLTSHLPVSCWHEQLGNPTPRHYILDRLVHDAHPIEMRGDSKRKNRGKECIGTTRGKPLPVLDRFGSRVIHSESIDNSRTSHS